MASEVDPLRSKGHIEEGFKEIGSRLIGTQGSELWRQRGRWEVHVRLPSASPQGKEASPNGLRTVSMPSAPEPVLSNGNRDRFRASWLCLGLLDVHHSTVQRKQPLVIGRQDPKIAPLSGLSVRQALVAPDVVAR